MKNGILLAMGMIAATALVGADRAVNAFLAVEGDGVSIDDDGSIVCDRSAAGSVTVSARPGWLVNGRESVSVDPKRGSGLKVTSKLGEDDGHVHVFPYDVEDVHIEDIVLVAEATPASQIAMYALPDTSTVVSASATHKVDKRGKHRVTTTYYPCVCGEVHDPQEVVRTYEVEPDHYEWTASGAGQTVESSTWTGQMSKGLRQRISFQVTGKRDECAACTCTATTNVVVDVHELSVTNDLYLGLDRTDFGRTNPVVKVAGALIDPEPTGSSAYSWIECGICSFTGRTDQAEVRYFAPDPDRGSASYLAEPLTVRGTATNAEGQFDSANCTTNFTVVKVDVTIDGVGEDKEEAEGAYTHYVPDGDAPIWAEEWTNSLKDVSITCEPHDGEMSQQTVNLTFDDEFLWAEKDDGTVEKAKHSYTVEELNRTRFKLHGHEKSSSYKDKEIVAEHEVSHAIDKAQFTVFGRPWLIPDYDRKDNIDDTDIAKSKGGKTVFRFWVNDDDDYTSRWMNLYDFEWPMSFSYPGGINGHNRNVQKSGDNCTNGSVDGQNDLVDFTPFLINLSEVFFSKEPDDISRNVKWELKSDCVKVVWTKLSAEKAESFHTEKNDECGEKLNKASCKADSTSIKDWTSFSPAFAEYVDNNKGVVLVEGCAAAGTNSKFQIRGMLDGKVLTRGAVNLSISEVEDMFRWINLRSVTGDNGGKMTNIANPTNRPDDECDSKHFVFVHGYNVNEDSAIGWASEVFKRFWQAGVKAKFVGVDWNGDKSQLYFPLPYWGTVAPNYYVNVENAFNSAASLKTELDKLNGPKVVLGHSLGNVLVSSAICDKGLECKYYLLNAAVAGEAYNKNFYAHEMVRASWRDIPQKIWAANWYALDKFSEYEDDFRKEIFWRSRFVSLKNAISYYSTTEDVLTNPTTNGLGEAWSKQELFKGSPIKIFASGKCDAGWSIRGRYYKEVPGEDPWDTETLEPGSTTDRILNLPLIKSLTENDIIQQPVFEKFGKETEQMHKLQQMRIADKSEAEKLRAYFLAHSVPATSFATGSNMTEAELFDVERDYKDYESASWPRDNSEWRHSDIKNVAYYYISKFYKDIVNEN